MLNLTKVIVSENEREMLRMALKVGLWAEQKVPGGGQLLTPLRLGSLVQGRVEKLWLRLTRVHQLPQLVHQSFITQSRVRCLGEGWILTEHAQNLVSGWTETLVFSSGTAGRCSLKKIPTHSRYRPTQANTASINAHFFDLVSQQSEGANTLGAVNQPDVMRRVSLDQAQQPLHLCRTPVNCKTKKQPNSTLTSD